MSFRRKSSFTRLRSLDGRRLRLFGVLMVVLAVVAPFPLSQAASAVVGKIIKAVTHSLSAHTTAPQNIASPQGPERSEAPRIKILMGETRDIPFAVPMTSVLIVSPEIVSSELHIRGVMLTGVTLKGLHVGETILIAFDGQRRYTFLVAVLGRSQATTQQNTSLTDPATVEQSDLSGSYSMSYSAPSGGGPMLFRQSFEFQRKLTQGRTLRFSSDIFKFMGQGDQDRVRATAPGLGLNRISLGIDGPTGSLDILDSQINVSPLSFNNYTMRGLHLVSAPTSRLHGMEFFAGLARPSLSFFDQNQGRVVGVVWPVLHGRLWRVRAGIFNVSPQQDNRLGSGGTVWHLDGRYAPSKNIAAEGEVAYANGGLSWRARLDLERGPVNAYGEILRFDQRSPLVSIGAQPGGRETEAFSVRWRPSTRFNASFNYNHTAIAPPASAGRAAFDRRTFFENASYRINQNSRISFRYTQQQIETGAPGDASHFRLDTRTAMVSHDIRFNKSWSNNFDVRLNSSGETRADAETESGWNFNDQLRASFKGGSATGFVHYARQKESLAGLIVRNPQLLPPLLQRAFALDPALFLQTNRDALASLLPGVDLPQTRGLDAGLRLQAAFRRVNLAGEARYSAGEILGRNQRNVAASVSMNMRLDAANSVQVSGSRTFAFSGVGGQSALTISYVHRFGAGSDGGFQFSRFLGLDRGLIQGRVFSDLNSNGQDEAGEPGVAGMRIQIDGGQSATTDEHGRFHFQINPGKYIVAMISDKLGVQLAASTATEQRVSLQARQTVNLSFGVSSFGSVAGRVFNDLALKGEQTAGSLPGVAGVRLSLRPMIGVGTSHLTVDSSGAYQFRNLPPGSYTLEIDSATLPADFRMPAQTSWVITVKPLQNFYLDVPLSAQRAIYGVVFVDKDGDGKFDAEKDEPVEGARVIAGKTEVTTGKGGTYILRNIPSGKIGVHARAPWGAESHAITIELGEGPIRRKDVNLGVKR